MIIYDEQGRIVENPDMNAGYTYPHYPENGDPVTIYHAWTDEELAAIRAYEEEQAGKKTDSERIAALEAAMTAIEEGIASV